MLIVDALAPFGGSDQLPESAKIQLVVHSGAGTVPPEEHQGIFDAPDFRKSGSNKANPIVVSPMRCNGKNQRPKRGPKSQGATVGGGLMNAGGEGARCFI